MFGRKKRHIKFLETENEILREKLRSAEKYADHLEHGDFTKVVLLNPDSVKDGKIVVTTKELQKAAELPLRIIPYISGDRYLMRVLEKI